MLLTLKLIHESVTNGFMEVFHTVFNVSVYESLVKKLSNFITFDRVLTLDWAFRQVREIRLSISGAGYHLKFTDVKMMLPLWSSLTSFFYTGLYSVTSIINWNDFHLLMIRGAGESSGKAEAFWLWAKMILSYMPRQIFFFAQPQCMQHSQL